MHWTIPLQDALWGAVVGYLSLWSVYWLFKLTTGKEGMGFGDFKLLAALGAWLGLKMVLPVILAASLIGAVVGIGMKMSATLREGRYVPFGPFLAGAGLAVMLAGEARVLGLDRLGLIQPRRRGTTMARFASVSPAASAAERARWRACWWPAEPG